MPPVAHSSARKRPKRQRPGAHSDDDDLHVLAGARLSESGGDALCTPAISRALHTYLQCTTLPSVLHTQLSAALRQFHHDLQLFTQCQPAVVGSFLLGLLHANHPEVDVLVRFPLVPPESHPKLYPRDLKDFKFHAKRYAFVQMLRAHFEQKENFPHWHSVSVSARPQPHALHVLRLVYAPSSSSSSSKSSSSSPVAKSVCVSVHVAPYENLFEESKLCRTHVNVPPWGERMQDEKANCVSFIYESAIAAYNLSLLSHMRMSRALSALHDATEKASEFKTAVQMLRLWAQRRHLCKSTFLHAALAAFALRTARVSRRAVAPHIFRAVLVMLTKFGPKGITEIDLDGMPVFDMVDLGLQRRFVIEAQRALHVLDANPAPTDPWNGVLSALFVSARGAQQRPVPLSTVFHAFVRVQGLVEKDPQRQADVKLCVDVRATLENALVVTGRVERIELIENGLYGLAFSSNISAVRKVDLKPDAVSELCFKAFWGDKVQLRRFNDGKIKHSIVWQGGPSTLQDILDYVFKRHFSSVTPKICARVVFGQLEALSGLVPHGETSALAIAALNELGKTLRSIEDLPLRIIGVHGVSPHFRYSAVQPPRPHPKGRFIEPLDVIAFFESSKSWPNDAMAISASKAGFYIALKNSLAAKGLVSQVTISHLDIFLADFVFRLRIRVDQEKDCYEDHSPDRARLVWQTEARVNVHNLLRNISGHALMGQVSRLAKVWLSRHLLFAQLGERAEELVELLVAKVFQTDPENPPKSVMHGFCMFLHLLSEFPWQTAPLVVHASDSAQHEDGTDIVGSVRPRSADDPEKGEEEHATSAFHEEAYLHFEAIPESKRPAMAVLCPCKDRYSWFDKAHSPERIVVERMVATAMASLERIENVICGKYDAKTLALVFKTPTKVYDVALQLNHAFLPRTNELAKGEMKAGNAVKNVEKSLVGFEPVAVLKEKLENELGDEALFLHDHFGGKTIYVKWRPYALKRRPFSVKGMRFCEPIEDSNELQPNTTHMIEAISAMAPGIIEKAEVIEHDSAKT